MANRSEAAMSALKAQTKIKNHAEEMGSYLKDMQKWEKSIKLKNKGLTSKAKPRKVPPVRASGGLIPVGTTATLPMPPSSLKKKSPRSTGDSHTYDKGYKNWEKFDVDAALKDVDSESKEINEDEEELVTIQTPATMVTHSSKALPQEGIHVVKPKPALQTPKEREAEERKKGNDYFQQGNFQKAIKAYTACLGISNRSVLAFSNRAMCWLKLKEWRKAEMDATLALQIDCKHIKSFQRRASARNAMGMHRAALGDLSESLDYANEEGGGQGANQTFIKAITIDIRKTKELLRSAMRNAPRTRVKVLVDYTPTMAPTSSTTSTSSSIMIEENDSTLPKEDIEVQDDHPILASNTRGSNENQVTIKEDANLEQPIQHSKKEDEDEAKEGNDILVSEMRTKKNNIRSSSTIKIKHSTDNQKKDDDDKDDDYEEEEDDRDKKNMLTPANLMSFKFNPANDKEDKEEQLSSSTSIQIEEEVSTENVLSPADRISKGGASTSSSSSTTTTSSKVKLPSDPKGPFEMERLWRACGKDDKMKLKLAKKWIKSDSKVMKKIFGNNKNNNGNSCPLDSDILCDILYYRMKPFHLINEQKDKLNHKKVKNVESLFEEFNISMKILIEQPKFISSISFFTSLNLSFLNDIINDIINDSYLSINFKEKDDNALVLLKSMIS